ncbi:MAG: cation-translocating P-type ATPase [Peptococcaceae bacterium]|nr:cation-translocating P-type ATPase [Peptococcaceae bacterium]
MNNINWHSLPIEEIFHKLFSSKDTGLDGLEADVRIQQYGENRLNQKPAHSLFSMFIRQMKEVLVLVLIAAAIISGLLGEIEDTIVIMIIVILNAVIGVIQENKAENALKALKDMTKPSAKALRDGKIIMIDAEKIVPGDIIILDAGDSVPADLRLIEAISLYSNESALTGESLPNEKDATIVTDKETSVGDRKNMLFMGTTITGGRAKAIAVETGMKTQLGRIAELLEASDSEDTPLQKQLAVLGKGLAAAAIVIVFFVFLLGLWRGENLLNMLLMSISLAVAAVPEGLPAVVTIVLALGVTRMSRQNAIVRRLPAVETLGTSTVICSDKTGTLTKNEMTVTKIFLENNMFDVTGAGYAPEGDILDKSNNKISPEDNQNLYLMLLGGLLNSDAKLDKTEKGYKIIGDPTEGALIVVAAKTGLSKEDTNRSYPRLAEIVFDSQRKMMTTFHNVEGSIISFTKGAPDVILSRSNSYKSGESILPLDDDINRRFFEVNSELASLGQRVLAISIRKWQEVPAEMSPAAETELIFIGFFAIQDPSRPEAKDAVAQCHRAGIKTVMITGDHLDTAKAIASELNIRKPDDQSLTGEQLDQMNDETLNNIVNQVTVYARVSPEHKLQIISALKHHGHVVAMTGDGVNDAPALKKADIGAAMGITGTEVAKEASDIILQDDNFATIVKAIEEGRTIYLNIQSTIQYLLSCNVGEIFVIFFALLLGLGTPLSPIMILWINLVTDGPPALALGLEPPQKGIMLKPPRKSDEGIFPKRLGLKVLWQGLMLGIISLGGFWTALHWGRSIEEAQTVAFITMALSQLIHSFNVRNNELSLFKIGIKSNLSLVAAFLVSTSALAMTIFVPFLRKVFNTVILQPSDWIFVLILSFMPFIIVEITKKLSKK